MIDPCSGDGPRLPVLLLAVAVGLAAAQSQAWASALGTATAVYSVLAGGSQDRRK
ncbi:hypothetical protein [Streptomyces europaeiscabiei]|uniref:hypothetical protein n=1 Tax=Streptomyces europaeiscabiei TaxID=146819 RepID=UPI002E168148|nr:hypothetical protein OHB30_11110 [Streptomyces europaeiscabiei]